MILKSVFSSYFFLPLFSFLTIIGRGAQPMIGGGGGSSGTPRYKVTPLQVAVISSQL